jgi:RNA polymerase sigma-70 factor (ECF subfamily)
MHEHHTADATVSTLMKHRDKLLGYVRTRIASPELAEDLLQDCLLKALRHAPELRDGDKFLPWFYRILNNATIDLYRGRGSAPARVDLDIDLLEGPSAEDEKVLCDCFRQLIPSLKPEYALLIEKMELETTDPAAFAEELGISRNTLKVRRHRARQALRRRLEETCRVCATHGCLDCTCAGSAERGLSGV